MKKMLEKTSIIAVAALFLTVSIMPMIAADLGTEKEQTIPIEISSIQENGLLKTETFRLTNAEFSTIIEKLTTLINLINMAKGEDAVANILLNFINGNNNPLLSKIINALLTSNMDFDRKVVVSAGWGLNINPFKKSQTEFVKPITFWHYAQNSDTLTFPSSTATLNLNPFEAKTMIGSQLGIMLRFRGVYVHIPQSYPAQSFTFFIGSAKHIINIELPTLQAPDGMME